MMSRADFSYGIVLPAEWVADQKELIQNFHLLSDVVAFHAGIEPPEKNADTSMWRLYRENVDSYFKNSPWKNLSLISTGNRLKSDDSVHLVVITKSLQMAFSAEVVRLSHIDLTTARGSKSILESFAEHFDIKIDRPSWLLTAGEKEHGG